MINRYETIFEVVKVLAGECDYSTKSEVVVTKAKSIFNAKTALVFFRNPETQNSIKTIVRAGEESRERLYHMLHMSVAGWTMKYNQSLISADIAGDDRFSETVHKELTGVSALCVPLSAGEETVGSILLLRKNDTPFTAEEQKLLENYAAVVFPFIYEANKILQYFLPPVSDESILRKFAGLGLHGTCPVFISMLRSIDAAVKCDVRVALEGASGTGKELIARAIHKLGGRNAHPFVAVDCGAIQPQLIESELFGHTKGAFTGANFQRQGLIEEADKGTLFMDEISNLPLALQSKFLRVIQEKEIRPVGSNRTRKVDIRIISAGSLPIRKMIEENNFREDLYYRLYVYPIYVPSLAERRKDIPQLAQLFLVRFASEQRKKVDSIHPDLVDFLVHREWAGNIRELENFLERLVTLAKPASRELGPAILPPDMNAEFEKYEKQLGTYRQHAGLNKQVEEFERKLLLDALKKFDWKQSPAARYLHISEQTMRYKMQRLDIINPKL